MKFIFLNLLLIFTLIFSSCSTFHKSSSDLSNRLPADKALDCKMLVEQFLKESASEKTSSLNEVTSTTDSKLAQFLLEVMTNIPNDKIASQNIAVFLGEKSSAIPEKLIKSVEDAKVFLKEKFPSIESIEKAYVAFIGKNQKNIFASSQQKASFLKWLAKLKTDVGDLKQPMSASKFQDLLNAVASFESQVVKENPFAEELDYSFVRLITNNVLEGLDVPPARLYDTDILKELNLEDYKERILNGIISTSALKEDLEQRAILGLPLEKSPEVLYPGFSRTMKIDLHKSGSKKIVIDNRLALTDSRQWGAFIAEKIKKDPSLKTKMNKNPDGFFRDLSLEFDAFNKKHYVDFITTKGDMDEAFMGFIDLDFISVFGKNFSAAKNLKAYQLKMDNWFLPDMVWRGHAYEWQKFTDEDMVDMFKNVHRQMASIQIGKKILGNQRTEDQVKIRGWILEDFARYNGDLLDNEVIHMARDHIETGPLYKTSYGYSTSKRWEVAKGFARGKTLAGYGDVDEVQKNLNSRILVGAQRGKKDLDMNRLNRFDDRFKYIYGRQQEVLGVGAADPDSIRFIQILDEEGVISKTFWRDTTKPWRIVLVKGDYREAKEPKADLIIKEYTLK